jgi:hypothetical protein
MVLRLLAEIDEVPEIVHLPAIYFVNRCVDNDKIQILCSEL